METRLGKMQKLVLVCIGVNTKEQSHIRRRVLTDSISKYLDCEKNKKLYGTISQSVGLLSRRGLITKRGSYIGLTDGGKDVARNVIEHIKSEYDGKIDWKIISKYYHKKEKDYLRYAKGSIEIINKSWDTYESFCANVNNFGIKKGDNVCVIHTPLHKRDIESAKVESKKGKKNKKTTKKIKSRKTKWKVFANDLAPELATEDNFEVYKDLLKMFPEVLPKVEERIQALFKHYDKVRETHPNYPPLTEDEWEAYPKAWKKIDDECNRLMKIQKNDKAFSDYLFEISHDKYPHIDDRVIRFAVREYQKRVEKK